MPYRYPTWDVKPRLMGMWSIVWNPMFVLPMKWHCNRSESEVFKITIYFKSDNNDQSE